MTDEDKQYIKGYNHGFFLRQYLPEIVDGIIEANKKITEKDILSFEKSFKPYTKGLIAGSKHSSHQQKIDKMKAIVAGKDYTTNHEKDFQKGFNQGYLLSQREPELLSQILKSAEGKQNNSYLDGVRAGAAQHQNEKDSELKKIKQQRRQKYKDNSKDIGLEHDD